MKKHWPIILVPFWICIIAAVRISFPERSLDSMGVRALWDTFFAICIFILTVIFSSAIGWKILLWFKVNQLTQLEIVVFSLAIGLGVLAYGVMTLGFVGLLTPWMVSLWGICVGVWTRKEWSKILTHIPEWIRNSIKTIPRLGVERVIVILFAFMIMILEFIVALAPPTGYDGLMYHLQGPLIFLREGRIILLPENWQANGPFTVEMLNTIGLAYGSDVYAQLIHLLYGVCLLLATFSFTRRFIGNREAWTAFAVLVSMPLILYLAVIPNVDFPWALYEFLALYCLLIWKEINLGKWLIIAGLFIGWAIGIKYFAFGWAGILGLWVLWEIRSSGIKKIILAGFMFGIPGLLIGLPWYIKNLLLSGNPIYPFVFGGPGWDPLRLDFYMTYADSFGAGKSIQDFLLLPIRIYTESEKFGILFHEAPSILFPLILFIPFTKRNLFIHIAACLVFFHLVLWAFSTQIMRYLLPVFPVLSVLTAYVVIQLLDRIPLPPVRRVLLAIIWGGMSIFTFFIAFLIFQYYHTVPVIVGLESKDAYLRRVDPSYSTQHYIKTVLSEQSKVFMMWDGKYYYCGERCFPDTDQSRWTRLFIEIGPNLTSMVEKLQSLKITHFYFNPGDFRYVNYHDLNNMTQRSYDFFTQTFIPACGKELYNDSMVKLFEFTCK